MCNIKFMKVVLFAIITYFSNFQVLILTSELLALLQKNKDSDVLYINRILPGLYMFRT